MKFTGDNLELVYIALEYAISDVHMQINSCPDRLHPQYQESLNELEHTQKEFEKMQEVVGVVLLKQRKELGQNEDLSEEPGPATIQAKKTKGTSQKQIRTAIDKRAEAMYIAYTNNSGIHCNRFPSWSELTPRQVASWRRQASQAIAREKRNG